MGTLWVKGAHLVFIGTIICFSLSSTQDTDSDVLVDLGYLAVTDLALYALVCNVLCNVYEWFLPYCLSDLLEFPTQQS